MSDRREELRVLILSYVNRALTLDETISNILDLFAPDLERLEKARELVKKIYQDQSLTNEQVRIINAFEDVLSPKESDSVIEKFQYALFHTYTNADLCQKVNEIIEVLNDLRQRKESK